MEEDSPRNYTDMEKLTKFSVSAALRRWLELSSSVSDPEISKLKKYLDLTKWSPLMVENCLNDVSKLLLCHHSVANDDFVQIFGPILIELLERASQVEIEATAKHLLMCCLLGKLITKNKAVFQFMMYYFQNHPSPFHEPSTKNPPPKKRSKTDNLLISDLELVLCCYNLIQTALSYLKDLWDWSVFVARFHKHSDPEVRWIVCQCLAILSDMSEKDKLTLVAQSLTAEDNRNFSLKYFTKADSFQESTAQSASQPDIVSEISKDLLTKSIVEVEGVLLPCFSPVQQDVEILVPVPSTRGHLQNLALAITSNLPVLISGPVGCGKTTLVEHVAALTGRTFHNQGLLKVQLGDQTDAKVLLGTYHSTDVPGEFVWTAGILTRAVTEGRWLLLEDINYAPMDVVSLLLPVVESLTLNIPGHGDVIQAAPGFQLFATQRTHNSHSDGGSAHNAATMLKKMWRRLSVEPLSRSELQAVIDARYPSLSPVTDKLLDAYQLLNDHQAQLVKVNDRALSPRDFFKWCQRIAAEFRMDKTSILSSASSQLYVFQDALDCFVASVSSEEKRLQVSEDIGARLNLVKAKAEFYCYSYKPTFSITDDSVSIGRVALARRQNCVQRSLATFSWTRSSSVLLERLGICVRQLEPVLLVGETGTGKTSSVQYLAHLLGHKLLVINLNQQSDSADLLGGYKPIDLKWKIAPVRHEFEALFQQTFNVSQNAKFLSHIATCFANRRWSDLLRLMSHSQQSAVQRATPHLRPAWEQLGFKLQQLRLQIRHADSALAFGFVEGSLVKALKQGDWVLLDEINLATAETLECLSGLLESQRGSLFLLERGDREPVERHPDFRLFAAMNPATDVGKKQLPAGLRSRFTEFVVDEITTPQDLSTLVADYLRDLNLTAGQIEGIVRFYLDVRGEALRTLMDGTGRQPHYSLRTLCRALVVAASNPCGTVTRSLYEAFCLSFLTQLDRSSHPLVEKLVVRHIVGKKNFKAVMGQAPPQPQALWKGHVDSIQVEGYWVPKGDFEAHEPRGYILTDSVRNNLKDLVRVVSLGRLPVLLQGETSVGKTSLINYLAQLTGNKCVRVNNHEHTDLQEYVGSYTADPTTGKLVFREGVLVDAMRQGHWLILDELNLAPSEVLEALNRLLDDNRELFIAETQETVKAHPRFLLFATQNPPGGHYGGRKMLSRAFRNRFVELHFDEIPAQELEVILHKRCDMPLSYCKRLVGVMTELQLRRRGSAAFAGKQGFMTLRDLFRWAERYRLATDSTAKFYDWDQHLADEGYLVLAGRVRKEEESLVIREVLQKQFKRTVDPRRLFTLDSDTSPVTRPILESLAQQPGFEHLVWTYALRRLAVLVGQAMRFVEPVLLVGDTGCGKTSVCQYLAAKLGAQLMTINCHQYSEGSDFLGGLRPVRTHEDGQTDRLFEWVDGPLVLSMTGGHYFLADEISLADDSVLERLNSVLEPERSLLLSEKAGSGEPELVRAHERFRFLSTMNPGGDYGKKELSPALRNRLTEIWCPLSRDRQDIIDIVQHNLMTEEKSRIATCMMDFIEWFSSSETGRKSTVSIRDILSWVQFINATGLQPAQAFVHGACLVFLDSLGNRTVVDEALRRLASMMKLDADSALGKTGTGTTTSRDGYFGIDPFYIEMGQRKVGLRNPFTFQAPSTSSNLVRLLRALQLKKPLLLEGSPGVGKTSLVTALAEATGHELVRINLSEQTDVSDLFGADLPVEGSETGGRFEWRDGPLLRALKEGQWIVLDELNLASQSVLEGLNAVLDHRGELYIPELGRSFAVRPEMTKLFACQNPLKQGGARKGLPRSFLNRFTQVYVEPLSQQDLQFIAQSVHPEIEPKIIVKMVEFNELLVRQVSSGQWGLRGGPWEFNLRDIFRWCQAIVQDKNQGGQLHPGEHVGLIYADRMRTAQDREKVLRTYETIFGSGHPLPRGRDTHVYATDSWIQVGSAILPRGTHDRPDVSCAASLSGDERDLLILQRSLPALESLMQCVKFNWMAILVGPRASGKTSLVRLAAQLTGHPLSVLNTNSAMDTTELLGGFEQGDVNRTLEELASEVRGLVERSARRRMLQSLQDPAVVLLLQAWENYKKVTADGQRQIRTTVDEAQHLERRAGLLANALDRIEDADCRAQVENIKGRLGKLVQQSNRAVNSGSSHSGGCFEWTDSLLVKALRQGHWLLVDNVNLCSPSVLDRLNGLLEPGGVLSLSERGVIDGQIPVVAPHPQFRLFLALDPRHGEISRAMRNRGVEIFVPDEVEYSDSDLSSVLSVSGLKCPLLKETLVAFHRWLCQYLPTGERPTLTELVQAASLAAQRLEMFSTSANPLSCLDDTCVEVYVRPIRSPADKEAARLQLAHLLQEAFVRDSRADSASGASTMTMTVGQVQQCPILARIRQATALVRSPSLGNAEDIQTAVLLLYLTASEEDLEWRRDFLLKMSALDTAGMHNALKSQLAGSNPSLPWDPRWFDCICRGQLGLDPEEDSTLTLTSNRISLALFWAARPSISDRESSSTCRTVGNVIRALEAGSLAEEAAPDKLLVTLPRFLHQWDRAFHQLLTSAQVGLTNADWAELLDAVQMRRHMADVDLLRMEDNDEFEASLSCLEQYWTWLLKRSASRLSKLLERFPLAGLEIPVNRAGEVGAVLSRRLRRSLERAEPFVDEAQSLAARLVASILSSASLPAVAESRQGEELLRDFARLLSSSTDARDVVDRLTDVDEGLRRIKEDGQRETAPPGIPLLVLALLDHLLVLQHYSGNKDSSTVLTAAVPTASAALIQCPSSSGRSLIEWLLSHWEIITRLSWSRRDQLQETSPVLSLTATAVLDRNGLVTLGESDEKRERLKQLEKIFWGNADQLQRTEFDPLLNDHKLAVHSLRLLIQGVCNALRIPDVQPEMWTGVGVPSAAAEAASQAIRLSKDPAHLGSLWLLQGLARCLLLAPGDSVDPVEKRKLKAVLRRREAENADRFLHVYQTFHQILVGGEMVVRTQHPHVRHFAALKQRLDSELAEETTLKPTWRPQQSLFQQLAKDARHYINSVASPESVFALHTRLRDFRGGRGESKLVLAQAELWLSAQRNFYQTLKTKYSDYPDLVVPLAAGVAQMIHGAELLVRNVRCTAWRTDFKCAETDLDSFVADLFDFPSYLAADRPAGLVSLAHLCTSSGVGDLFDAAFDEPGERNGSKKALLFSALKDVERYASHARRLVPAAWDSQLAILDALVASWSSAEERRKQRELEQESLYKSRTIHHEGELSDAEADKRALEQFFPSYEDEFAEDVPVSMETDAQEEATTETAVDFELTPEDMMFICESHVSLLNRWSRSMSISAFTEAPPTTPDGRGAVAGGFLMRYPLLGRVLAGLEPCLSTRLDRRMMGAHLVFMDHVLKSGQPEEQTPAKGKFDFYHDPCVTEAVQCRPVLEHLRSRIRELLAQWPGHAALQDIIKLAERILGFTIDSPLMKLVTGLEMLLSKCHEWETNAHQGVSIAEDIQALSRLILRWRTMELDCWKYCLDSVDRKAASSASKYWFHLYSTVTSLVRSDSEADLTQVQSTIRQFMGTSTLGQYDARLRMLEAFARHVPQSGQVTKQNEPLLRLLWHALLFYGQFQPLVAKRKAALRQPIEKKVREFIKIMRWNDINYYALKEAVHKAHSTLHKLMKEWRDVLEQPARTVLNECGIGGGDVVETAAFAQTPVAPFLSSLSIREGYDPSVDYPILSRLPSYYTKCLKYCERALNKCPYPQRVRVLDDLVGTVITSVEELQKLKVIGTGENKEKQKREAKSISMRKRNSLFQLFKSLTKMGISYRKGSFLWSKETKPLEALETILPVLEVEASLENLPERPTHLGIRQAWNKGPLYYSRCLARLATSASLLEKPSGELGPSVVERIKGFSAQLMVKVQDQWKDCSRTLDYLVRLRLLVSQLTRSAEGVPESSVVVSSLEQLWQLTIDALATLEEFETLMEACPSDQTGCQVFQLSGSVPVTQEGAFQLLSLRSKLVSRLQDVRLDLEKQFHLFWISSAPCWLFNVDQWAAITEGFKTLQESTTLLEEMASKAGPLNFGCTLQSLKQRFNAAVEGFRMQNRPRKAITGDPKDVDKLCQSILFCVQEVYNKHSSSSIAAKTEEDAESDDDLEDDHLTDKLAAEMHIDLAKLLKLDAVTSELSRCLETAIEGRLDPGLLLDCAPLFDQYVSIVEYYFTMQLSALRTSSKLLSVLLNVFNQLLEKGFCLPAELDDSKEGGAGTKFEENESGGLGDGEGAKDVSDQIEDEDQLDTARQKGQEEEEGSKDDQQKGPKEEENGIEMSEDFDAELQDREKKEGEEGDSSDSGDDEDEEQLDKEMGQTGEGADQLDEKLWGSDEEEEDEDDKDQEEGKGDGQKMESEITAKQGDDEDEEGDDNGQDKKKQKPKPLDENEDDDENINDDQIDPYHTSHDPPDEPEPLDVPEDLNLDGGDNKDKDEEDGEGPEEENPFDIDAMKEDANLEEDKGQEEGKEEEENGGEDANDQPDGESSEAPFDPKEENPSAADEEESGGEEGKEKEIDEAAEGDEPQPAAPVEEAVPSKDKPAEAEAQPAAEEAVKGSQDKTSRKEMADTKPEEEGGQNDEADNEETEGIGMAESRQTEGHDGQQQSKVNRKTLKEKEEDAAGKGKPKKPGESDPNRALANSRKERILQVHTTEPKSQTEENGGPEHDESAVDEDNLFEHIKKVDQLHDALARDAATEEQAREQLSMLREDDDKEEKKEDDNDDEDVTMKEDEAHEPTEAADQLEAETLPQSKRKGQKRGEPHGMEEGSEENLMEVEGETALTMSVQRGPESNFVTQADLLPAPETAVSMETVELLRNDLEQRLSTWSTAHIDDSEGQETWRKLEMVTSDLAQDLCESLRLILEPSQASRLKGDYRTGKRLNMRKVIPYIASQFRKDRIWLRRTKPAQRNYQIVLAVDDSSSMADNRSKELAFESVALISKALCLLEAGQLGVVSFGENVQLLHPLHDPFTDASGPKVLQQFTFEQKKTKISELVDFVNAMMSQAKMTSSAQSSSTAQLMLIVSDGRGLFSEGADCVHQAIRRAKQAGLFMVFVILDNPEGKDSILDIRTPVFDGSGKLLGIKPYLDDFPFPFYVILRDIKTLPVVLSDALRQWFELVTSASSL